MMELDGGHVHRFGQADIIRAAIESEIKGQSSFLPENIQADGPVGVDVGMVDLCCKGCG
jgi:hypothetical protein